MPRPGRLTTRRCSCSSVGSRVPHVTINLYQEGVAADGSQTLTLVDTTQTSSWDDWAQGFRLRWRSEHELPGAGTPKLRSSSRCMTSHSGSTLQPEHGGLPCQPIAVQVLRRHAQLNQVQPAPYDGMYQFPSVTDRSGNRKTNRNELHGLRTQIRTPRIPDRSRHSNAAGRQVCRGSRSCRPATNW